MDPLRLIDAHYRPGSRAHDLLLRHSLSVARKALSVADKVPHLNPDRRFVWEAAMLHDIGIFMTDSADLGCHGDFAYVCHGYLGRELLEKQGLDRHALVCERHVGTGLSLAEIRRQQLPLPQREMRPLTVEEQIICYADKFFSKYGADPTRAKGLEEIVAGLARYGREPVEQFLSWSRRFGDNDPESDLAGEFGSTPVP